MRCVAFFLSASCLASPTLALFGSTKLHGQTKLFGNSFGVLAENATFDYVVVGGGTAGLAIASRLAAGDVSVAVIEAGSFYEMDNGNVSQVPGYGAKYLTFDNLTPSPVLVDWGLITEPQSGLSGRRIHYTAGKTLGGSSAVNDMIFHRGTKGSFQQWADLVGDITYTWDKFLPYLKKSVAFTRPRQHDILYDPSAFSPSGGPLQVSYPHYQQPFDKHLHKAFSSAGIKPIRGLNSGHLNGFSAQTLVVNPAEATRSSSEASFLQQALDRARSPKLYLRSLAKKVLFSTSSKKKATGVLVETNGAEYVLSARKEVIVSAGVFHSPHILLLSGIGPAKTLEGFGIPVVSDLRGVGQNMLDHVFVFTSHEMNLTTNSGVLSNPSLHAQAVETYINHQNGPLTGVGGGLIGWEKLPNRTWLSSESQAELSKFADDWPEVEYVALGPGSNPKDQPLANNYVSLTAALQTTPSRGNVTLRSPNVRDAPVINVNGLSTKAEAELVVGAMKRIRELAAASQVHVREHLPGPDVVTDAEILKWARTHAVNGYHASSTCAMGKSSDRDAVVDRRGKVHGVEGLRVVDASIFPLLPPGHPMNTIYALAELFAEDILHVS